jgi:GNAT superfamily N-acetyltransferase
MIVVRQYRKDDHEEVVRLHREGINQIGVFFDDPAVDNDLDDIEGVYLKRGEYLIATIGNRVVGMGALRRVDGQTAEIKRMRVDRELQGEGVGSRILDELIQKATELGYRRLILDTVENNKQARTFYEKRGFRLYQEKTISGLRLVLYERLLE